MYLGVIIILFALSLAVIDSISLPLIAKIRKGKYPKTYLIISAVLAAIQVFIFYGAIKYTTMTQMNIMWDVLSDVLVTLVGLFILKETVGINAKLGLFFAAIAIFFFAREDSNKNHKVPT